MLRVNSGSDIKERRHNESVMSSGASGGLRAERKGQYRMSAILRGVFSAAQDLDSDSPRFLKEFLYFCW